MPPPVDLDLFRPDPAAVVAGRVGCVGRFDDPRKNLALFLEALALARSRGAELTGEVIGGVPAAAHLEAVDRRGLAGAVDFVPYLAPPALAERLRRLDLLAVTSHQEGLGIAALEAMGSGCPVVATRCGGPEEYVVDGVSGRLTGFSAAEVADGLAAVAGDRRLRAELSRGARETVESRYSWAACRGIFGAALAEHASTREERRIA
jgi:glycosyltransferase involved in cell wall biosynthesis